MLVSCSLRGASLAEKVRALSAPRSWPLPMSNPVDATEVNVVPSMSLCTELKVDSSALAENERAMAESATAAAMDAELVIFIFVALDGLLTIVREAAGVCFCPSRKL